MTTTKAATWTMIDAHFNESVTGMGKVDGGIAVWIPSLRPHSGSGVPPDDPVNEHMIFHFCSECVEKLENDRVSDDHLRLYIQIKS